MIEQFPAWTVLYLSRVLIPSTSLYTEGPDCDNTGDPVIGSIISAQNPLDANSRHRAPAHTMKIGSKRFFSASAAAVNSTKFVDARKKVGIATRSPDRDDLFSNKHANTERQSARNVAGTYTDIFIRIKQDETTHRND
jgi:hypothetical protein